MGYGDATGMGYLGYPEMLCLERDPNLGFLQEEAGHNRSKV